MELRQYVELNFDNLRQARSDGVSWSDLAASASSSTGRTVSIGSLSKTFGRMASTQPEVEEVQQVGLVEALPAEPIQAEKSAKAPQITAVQKSHELSPYDHLIRLVGHRVSLMGWTDFLQSNDLLDRIQKRHPKHDFSMIECAKIDDPISHLMVGWSLQEFGCHMAEKIDVHGFWKDRIGGEVEARENRVFEHYKTDRRALFIEIVGALIDDDQAYKSWLLHRDGRGYYNTVQKIDNEVAAGRGGDNVNAVIFRVREQVKSSYRDHLQHGRAA
jgi:hypothetical protein